MDHLICGDYSPGSWENEDNLPVKCTKPPGHDGEHAGGTMCGTLTWSHLKTNCLFCGHDMSNSTCSPGAFCTYKVRCGKCRKHHIITLRLP